MKAASSEALHVWNELLLKNHNKLYIIFKKDENNVGSKKTLILGVELWLGPIVEFPLVTVNGNVFPIRASIRGWLPVPL